MLTTSAAYKAAVGRPVRTPIARVRIGFVTDPRPGNRFTDPSFETSLSGFAGGPIAGTEYATSHSTISPSAIPPHTGSRSIGIDPFSDQLGVGEFAHASAVVRAIPRARYRVSGFTRLFTPDPDPDGPIEWGDILDPGGRVPISPVKGLWQPVSVAVTVPDDGRVRVGLRMPRTDPAQTGFYAIGLDDIAFEATLTDPVDVTRYVESVSVDRSLSTDLPAETTLVVGYSKASATVELGGDPEDQSMPGRLVWSRFSTVSPFRGMRVPNGTVSVELGYDTGDGTGLLPALTGGVGTGLRLRASADVATVDALDGADALSGQVMIPPVVGNHPTDRDHRGGLNTQWVVDYVARSAGYCASPPARDTAIFSATFHGALVPEVGRGSSEDLIALRTSTIGKVIPGALDYAPGRFGLAPAPPANIPGFLYETRAVDLPAQPDPQSGGTDILVEGWVRVGNETSDVTGAEARWNLADAFTGDNINVELTSHLPGDAARITVTAQMRTSGGSLFTRTAQWNGSIASGWHYLGVYLAWGPLSFDVLVRVDGRPVETVTSSGTSVSPNPASVYAVTVAGLIPIEATQISLHARGAGDPVEFDDWSDSYQPNAELEPGLSELTALPSTRDRSGWQVIQDIAAAELATAFITADNTFRFWNRRHWRDSPAANTVVAALASTSDLVDLDIEETAFRAVEQVTAITQPLSVRPLGLIWHAKQALSDTRVPVASTREIIADLGDDTAVSVDTSGGIIPTGGAEVNMRSAYRASRNPDGTGGSVTNLTMSVDQVAANQIRVRITNPNAYDVYLVSPANAGFPTDSTGTPTVALIGELITTEQTPAPDDGLPEGKGNATGIVVRAGDSGNEYTVPTTPWLQRTEDARALVTDLLRALRRPVPQLGPVRIIARPELELGDRVLIQDSSGTGLNDPYWVTGITTEFGVDSGMTQSVTLRPVAAPGQWILGVTGRSELGETTIL